MRRFVWPGLVVLVLLVGGFWYARQPPIPKPITLTYWGLWETPATLQPLIDEYQASHPNVTINYIQSAPTEYRERLQTSLAQGSGPDIFRFHNTWVPMLGNFLSPLPQAVYSPGDFARTFYPVASRDLSRGGQLVGLPLEFDGLAMVVNEKILSDSHQPVPTSWDQLHQIAVAISKCDSPDKTCTTRSRILLSGVALGDPENVDHWQDILSVLSMQNGVNLAAPQGQQALDVLDYFTSFVKTDHIWDNTLPKSTTAFTEGKVAIIFAPSWKVLDILIHTAGFKVGVYPIPQVPVDPNRGEKETTWASYWVEGVNKSSPNTAAAWDFLKFLTMTDSLSKYYHLVTTNLTYSEPPSRVDLAGLPPAASFGNAFLVQAPWAKSWYLASDTSDGPLGINTRFSGVYSAALLKLISGSSSADALNSINLGTNQILSSYGLAAPFPTGR